MIRSAVFYAGNSILLLQFFSADVAEYIVHAVWFIKIGYGQNRKRDDRTPSAPHCVKGCVPYTIVLKKLYTQSGI